MTQSKKNQTIERFLIIEQNKQPKFSERFSPPKRILIDFIIYSVHFTSVEIPSAISWYLSLISSISTNCCCCCSYESTPDNPIHIHTQRERHNTHQIETMGKRKIAQWSKQIELSLTDQKKSHTYTYNYAHSFTHSLSHYTWVVKKPIAHRLTRNCVSRSYTCTFIQYKNEWEK